MDYDESSDILGGRLHVSPQSHSVFSDPGRITLLLGLGLAALYVWVRVAPNYRQWKETRYRKAMRRRHGIPDDDNRPFNVAYAAALQAKKSRGGRGRAHDAPPSLVTHDEEPERSANVPQSTYIASATSNSAYFDQGTAGHPPRSEAPVHSQPHFSPEVVPQMMPRSSSIHQSRNGGVKQHMVTRPLHGKHALDDQLDDEFETQAKKTRVEKLEHMDGQEEAGWQESSEEMDVDEVHSAKRGSKRGASTDDDGLTLPLSDRLDKRARKVSVDRSSHSSPDHEMEDEVNDEAEEITGAARGKKRDRAEAGSTFGGDDSLVDDEDKPQRHRRRRTVSNKLGQAASRGQKRGRDLHSLDSDDSDLETPRRRFGRKKRGRRSQDEVVPLSNDPLCKGRRIGEEWEANGVHFKVGPNGQRLRQELVKKSRSRFPMPSDSQHPDRRANVDVYVETWLSEEEYADAKERHELAWQDPSSSALESQDYGDVPDFPSKIGKNLLWSSTMSSRESPVKRGPFRQSVVTNVGLKLNIFPPAPAVSNRRISSIYQTPSSPATDSPKLQKSKSYSKWEKQDLEAAAMSKIRDRQQAARSIEPSKPLASASSGPTPAPPLFGATTSATFNPLKAAEKPATANPSFSLASPAATSSKPTMEFPKLSTPTAASSAAAEPTKSTASSFAFPSAAPPTAASTPAASSQSSKPSSAQPSTTPAAPSTSIPSFFSKPAMPATAGPQAAAPHPPNSTFSFGGPARPQAGSSAPSFGTAANGATKMDQAKPSPPPAPASGGNPLFSRLGMGPPPSTTTSTVSNRPESAATNAPAASSSTSSSSVTPGVPKFSFGVTGKPSATAPAPPTSAAPIPATSTPVPMSNAFAPSSAPSSAATGPKPTFSFGVTNNSSQPATSTPASAFGGNTTKDTASSSASKPSTFSFGAGSAFAGSSASSASKPNEPPKPTFSFGAPAGTNVPAFGGSSAAPTFGSASTTTSASSPFGGATSTPSTASPFGAPSSGGASKPEAPKSAFGSFGGNGSSPATPSAFGGAQNGVAKGDEPAKPSTFSFAAASSKPVFGASSAPSTAPAFGTTSTPSSAFGGSSTPAFGATATTGGSTSGSKPTFSFGSTPTAGPTTTSSTTENKPPSTFSSAPSNMSMPSFSFGTQPAAATSGAAAPSPFGAAPSAQQGPSAFGFGAPSGSFSFGSNAGQSAQK